FQSEKAIRVIEKLPLASMATPSEAFNASVTAWHLADWVFIDPAKSLKLRHDRDAEARRERCCQPRRDGASFLATARHRFMSKPALKTVPVGRLRQLNS